MEKICGCMKEGEFGNPQNKKGDYHVIKRLGK